MSHSAKVCHELKCAPEDVPLEVQGLLLVLKVCHVELQSVPPELQGVPLVLTIYTLELNVCP